ncbi:hypothetical protein FACS1894200_11370 [Spirochaetia bacterium]|nr:hypothetical protein FACS1894200_11370 [Spirochaetia bacterium]
MNITEDDVMKEIKEYRKSKNVTIHSLGAKKIISLYYKDFDEVNFSILFSRI